MSFDEEIDSLGIDWDAKPQTPQRRMTDVEYCMNVIDMLLNVLPRVYIGIQMGIIHPPNDEIRKESQKNARLFESTIKGIADKLVRYSDARVTNMLVLKAMRQRSLEKMKSG